MNRPGLRSAATKSVSDPGPDTLRETIEGLWTAMQEAARLEAAADHEYKSLRPGDVGEKAAQGWMLQSRAEKDHWRDYLAVYRRWLQVHPELADKPVGTRCAHGPSCTLDRPIERDPGSDDDETTIPAPHWTERSPDAAP